MHLYKAEISSTLFTAIYRRISQRGMNQKQSDEHEYLPRVLIPLNILRKKYIYILILRLLKVLGTNIYKQFRIKSSTEY